MNRKILFVAHDTTMSGSLISLGYLIRAFIEKKYEVFVQIPFSEQSRNYLTSLGANCIYPRFFKSRSIALSLHFTNTVDFYTSNGIKIFIYDLLKTIYGMIYAVQVYSKIKPDIVYVNEYVLLQYSIAAKLVGLPSVCHIRSPFLEPKYSFRRRLISTLITKYNKCVIAITEFESQQITRYSPSQNVHVIPEFLDDFNFRFYNERHYRLKYNIENEMKIILFLGGIDKVKNTEEFLLACKVLFTKHNNIIVVLAGKEIRHGKENEDYYRRCQNIISHYENKCIRKMNELINPIEILSISSLVVSISSRSHFSRPIIEAWAQKKAVIASDTDHNRNLITNGVNGLLVPKYNINELSRKIDSIINDDNYANLLGENGYKKALQDYSAGQNEMKVIKLVEQAIN